MLSVAVLYNEPVSGRYQHLGEQSAVRGVLEEVEAVSGALTALGHSVSRVPLLPPLERAGECIEGLHADLVFNLFEGFDGSPAAEVSVADMLSRRGLAFTGNRAPALALALDKGRMKEIIAAAGIRTPRHQVLTPETVRGFGLRFPCIVKPCAEDASHGLSQDSVVGDAASLERQVALVCDAFGGGALVEEYVGGREFNATVIGTAEPWVLPIAEIEYTLPEGMPRILTFAAKWEPESLYCRCTTPVCPAAISPELERELGGVAVSVFRLLGCSGYARVDLRLDEGGRPFVLEANPNCDIAPDYGAARQARAAGMTYPDFIQKIVTLALEGVAA